LQLAIYFLPYRGKSGEKGCNIPGPVLPTPQGPKLLNRVRATLRLNRYSPQTEATYGDWIKRFIRFHGVRHSQEMSAYAAKAFLSHLAIQMNVARANQTFSAFLLID
jgi:hypothetical protein